MPNNPSYAFLFLGYKLKIFVQEREAILIMDGSLEACSVINIGEFKEIHYNKWTPI